MSDLLERLTELEAKATEGPWTHSHSTSGINQLVGPNPFQRKRNVCYGNKYSSVERDFQFIATLRNAWPTIRKALEQYHDDDKNN